MFRLTCGFGRFGSRFVSYKSHGRGRIIGNPQKNVFVINTGGMQAKLSGITGGKLCGYMKQMTELQSNTTPRYDLHEWDELLFSTDISSKHISKLAQDIEEKYLDYDGFVVCIGEDCMPFVSSALSFMLRNLNKPVIFTGGCIPIEEVHSDSRRNLALSISLAADDRLNEVSIFYHDKLMRGNRTTRFDADAVDGFYSPNYPPLVEVGKHIIINEDYILPASRRGAFCAQRKILLDQVVTLRIVPNFSHNFIRAIAKQDNIKCVVLQLFGTGNFPSADEKLLNAVEDIIKSGKLVAVTLQCDYGAASLGTYTAGKVLLDLGVISAMDMTTEATVTKFACLLGSGLNDDQIRDSMNVNLRGEITSDCEGKSLFTDGDWAQVIPVTSVLPPGLVE